MKALFRNLSIVLAAGLLAAGSWAHAADVKVEKAPGANAYTVGEVFAKKSELSGKKVVVRGKVVKIAKQIMGKNWVHLQDGSGDLARGTGDLVVTTQDAPAVGSVVTASGTLAKDRDFGSGYRYDALVEDAHLK